MLTLKELLDAQHPGVRQNPYKYRIICIMDIYNNRHDELTLNEFKKGKVYLNIEDIPQNYYDYGVYNIEPERDENTGCLYLRIELI